jgi:hypothetical protein
MAESIMDSVATPPPKWVKNMWAWAHAVQKLYDRNGLTPDDEGFNYGAAVNIYRRTLKKYGQAVNADPMANLEEMTTHSRADLLALKAPVWTLGHNAAWSATDEAHQRLYFQEHFHLARAANDTVVVEPIFVWRVERHEDGQVRDVPITDAMALWLVESNPTAVEFVRQRMANAEGALTRAMSEVDLVDATREVAGVTVVPDQLDHRKTKDLMREASERLTLEPVA